MIESRLSLSDRYNGFFIEFPDSCYDTFASVWFKDPYHGPGQAMGLSFSVPEGEKLPSSLLNIFKELQKDVGCSIPRHGNLQKWAVQVYGSLYLFVTSVFRLLWRRRSWNSFLAFLF